MTSRVAAMRGTHMEEAGSFRRIRRRRLLPMVGIGVVALALTGPGPDADHFPQLFVPAAVCLTAIFLLGMLGSWERWPRTAGIPMVFVACVGIALLGEASGGGNSGYLPLLLLPLAWQTVYGRRLDMAAAIVMTSLTAALPLLYVEGSREQAALIRQSVLFALVATGGGYVAQDIVRDREALLASLRHTAASDPLTGLENRGAWDALLGHEVAFAAEHSLPLSVALIDLDHFKAYNDEHGHLAGDDLLREMAAEWLTHLRPGDRLARWGGEEFALLLPATGLEDARRVLRRLLDSAPGVTCSAGLVCNDRTADARELVAEADRLLYAAKEAGRSRIVSELGVDVVRPAGDGPEGR